MVLESAARLICFEEELEAIARESTEKLPLNVVDEQLAYVVYTSGSSGKPKGVMVDHLSLIRTYLGWEEAYRLYEPGGSHLQMASPSFDVFTADWTRALCSGDKLVLCPRETVLDPEKLYELLRREEVKGAEFVPAVMRGLVHHLEKTGQRLDFMRWVVVSSDTWYVGEYRQTRRLCGDGTRLINAYGVTEGTIDNTWLESVSARHAPESVAPIGRPFAYNRLHVLDSRLAPVPCGVPAELCLGGPILARGYLGRPGLTAQKFVPDPYCGVLTGEPAGLRLYRTGDLARYLPDGGIDFIGRIDTQVKIRGFRIELGEIKAQVESHPAVRDAAVMVREDRPGDRRLVGYVVKEPGRDLTADELRRYLQERLPGYMVPSPMIFLDAVPLNPNGKVDHGALPAPDAALLSESSYVAPETAIERTLAGIFSELLGLERVGVNDNFFDLGGNSLSATQLLSRIRAACQVELSLATFFGGPTIADVARGIEVIRRVVADTVRERGGAAKREEGEL